MKNIFLSISSLFMVLFANAQSAPGVTPDANAKNTQTATETTINGMPYNQYKLQTQAKQQAEKSSVASNPMKAPALPQSAKGNTNPFSNKENGDAAAKSAVKLADFKGTSLEAKTIKADVESKQAAQGPTSTDPTPAAKKTEFRPQGGGN